MNKKVLGLSAVLLSTNLITTSTLSSFSQGSDFDQGAKSVASDFLSQFNTSSSDPFVLLQAVLVYQNLDDEVRQLIDLSLPATGSNHRLVDLLANAIIAFNQTNTDPDLALDLSNAVQLVRYQLPPVFINPNIELVEPDIPQETPDTETEPADAEIEEKEKDDSVSTPLQNGSEPVKDSPEAKQKETVKKPSAILIDSSGQGQNEEEASGQGSQEDKLDDTASEQKAPLDHGSGDVQNSEENNSPKAPESGEPEPGTGDPEDNGVPKENEDPDAKDDPQNKEDNDKEDSQPSDGQDVNNKEDPGQPDFSEEKERDRQRMEQLKERFFGRFFEQSDPLAALEIQLSMGAEMQDFSQDLKDYLEEAFFEAHGYSMMDFFEQQIRGLYELSKTNADFLPAFTRLYEQNKDCPAIAELFQKLDPILVHSPETKEPEPEINEPVQNEPEKDEPEKEEKRENPSSDTEVVERRLTPSFGGFKSLSQRNDRTITLWPGKEIQLLPDFDNQKAWKGSASPYNTPTLWGQCTWFAWGRFYEIYGFSPGFSGNGYECAGQLISAHPSLFSLSKTPVPGAVFSSDAAHNHVGLVLEVDEENNKLTIQEGNLDAISNPLWSDAIQDWRTIVLSLDQLKDLYGNVVFANPTNLRSLQVQNETTQSRQDTLADPKALNQALPELAIDRYKTQL